MIALTKKFYRDHRLGIILTTLGLVGMQWTLINLFPVFIKAGAGTITADQPKVFQAFFGSNSLSLSTLEGFFRGEYLTLTFVIIVAGYLIALVTSEFTKETESGTLESLLSLPVSRSAVICYKYVNITLLTAYFTVVGFVPFILLALANDFKFNGLSFLVAGILSFLFLWAVASITVALSVFFSERNKPVFIALFILGYGYILNSLSQAFAKIPNLKFLTIFYYYDTVKALGDKTIGISSLTVFAVLIAAGTVFSFYWFTNRDFS
jgi:ABC-2 type transport system permease protein